MISLQSLVSGVILVCFSGFVGYIAGKYLRLDPPHREEEPKCCGNCANNNLDWDEDPCDDCHGYSAWEDANGNSKSSD